MTTTIEETSIGKL